MHRPSRAMRVRRLRSTCSTDNMFGRNVLAQRRRGVSKWVTALLQLFVRVLAFSPNLCRSNGEAEMESSQGGVETPPVEAHNQTARGVPDVVSRVGVIVSSISAQDSHTGMFE